MNQTKINQDRLKNECFWAGALFGAGILLIIEVLGQLIK